MKLGIAEILEKTSKIEDRNQRIDFLRRNDSAALRRMLEFAFDKRIEWDLPAGIPPYKPCLYLDQETMLYSEMKKMYLFLKGGNPNLKSTKREHMFIQLLESIPPADAQLLASVKDHVMPYEAITEDLVRDAFPDLLKFPPTPKVEENLNNEVEKPKIKKAKKKKIDEQGEKVN